MMISAANNYINNTKLNWRRYWQNKNFRRKIFIGFIFLIVLLLCLPIFFQYIEQIKGASPNDFFLNLFPAYDVSTLIFALVWSNAFLMCVTAIGNPDVLLNYLISHIVLSIFRIFTIILLPLQAPPNLIFLTDPLANHFYGVPFITKDLFFSGHTSTLFLIFLFQRRKALKYYALLSSICVGILVIVQHMHYTIDVIFAYLFAYLSYYFVKNWVLQNQFLPASSHVRK